MMGRSLRPLALLSLGALVLASCGGADEPPATPATEADATVEGLSPEEIRAQAAEMSPTEAEALGIVDTTMYMENLANPDSLVELDTASTIIRTIPPQ